MSEWIKCDDRLPETPKTWEEWVCDRKTYVVAYKVAGVYCYQSLNWCDGWNCSMNPDGTIAREHQIMNIVAWCEVPEYNG